MGLYWGMKVDLMEREGDQTHLYGMPGRRRGVLIGTWD